MACGANPLPCWLAGSRLRFALSLLLSLPMWEYYPRRGIKQRSVCYTFSVCAFFLYYYFNSIVIIRMRSTLAGSQLCEPGVGGDGRGDGVLPRMLAQIATACTHTHIHTHTGKQTRRDSITTRPGNVYAVYVIFKTIFFALGAIAHTHASKHLCASAR